MVKQIPQEDLTVFSKQKQILLHNTAWWLRTEIELSPTHSSKASNITTGRESILRAFPTAFPAVLSTGQ
ncbi:hypothetical protein Y1Q_0009619 [Alligator mississippiensis]|uniref:Uncharacterized protein n=1 Tax=Alligator mississippiensis TaxID=8496 RepID=A0A151NUR3_ALLMI|nr:hypothetical protein Y1Q_0009619 [Alligator mississippiensis]